MKLEKNESSNMGNGSFNQEGRFMGQEGSIGLIGGKTFLKVGDD